MIIKSNVNTASDPFLKGMLLIMKHTNAKTLFAQTNSVVYRWTQFLKKTW